MLQQAAITIYERGSRIRGALRRRLQIRDEPEILLSEAVATAHGLPELAAGGVQRVPLAGLLGDKACELLLAGPPGDHGTMVDGGALLKLWPAAYRLGLEPALANLAEAYVGEPCFYLGAMLKREIAGAPSVGTRLWHLDIEDRRMLRVIVYLSDVPAACGPFEYIAVGYSRAVQATTGYRSGYLDDEAMARLVPRTAWTAVTGRAGDAVVFDGARVFHRAQPPRDADRLSLTFAYSSRRPLELRVSARLPATARRDLAASLDARVAACLPPARRF